MNLDPKRHFSLKVYIWWKFTTITKMIEPREMLVQMYQEEACLLRPSGAAG